MPRRPRRPGRGGGPSAGPPQPLVGGWLRQEEDALGDVWTVRSVSGSSASKAYRCPGCRQEIVPATPHVVAWPADEPEGSVERRHWHTDCWRRRPGHGA